MTFKNDLISSDNFILLWKRKGQAVIEYLIIFIAVALTVITFISQVHNEDGNGVLDRHFTNMTEGILR